MIKEFIIDLELSSVCNLFCVYCPRDKIKRERKFITQNAISQLAKHVGPNKIIWFSGMGEPFLHSKIDLVVEKLKATGAMVYANTNGTALNFKEHLIAAVDAGLDFLNISVYGLDYLSYKNTTTKDLFNQLRENILTIKETVIPYRISYVANSQTPVNIRAILRTAFGTNNIRILREHHRSFLKNQQKIIDCGLAHNYLFISCDGDVLSCVNDVSGINNFGKDILEGSEKKRSSFPFLNCAHCDSGRGIKSFNEDFMGKILDLSKKL